MKTNKKGISLIVLVITIIVMIILATAVILSLDGSDIINEANSAVKKYDLANAKTVVDLADAEWQLMSQSEREEQGNFEAYVTTKLVEAGFDESEFHVQENGRVLYGIAAMFEKNNVPIGTTVTGYILDSENTTYTTTGKENTSNVDNNIEQGTQTVTLTRDINVTWRYFGIDKDGSALIVGSVTSTTPSLTLGGKGGYVYGPAVLNEICEEMYSSNMGNARSINIYDVMRVIEYSGSTSGYWRNGGNFKSTEEPLTVKQICNENKVEISALGSFNPEEDKNIEEYLSNYFTIHLAEEEEYNTDMKEFIFPSRSYSDLKTSYWIASSLVGVSFANNSVSFFVPYVLTSTNTLLDDLYNSKGASTSYSKKVRPVVSLYSEVEMTYDGNIVTLK